MGVAIPVTGILIAVRSGIIKGMTVALAVIRYLIFLEDMASGLQRNLCKWKTNLQRCAVHGIHLLVLVDAATIPVRDNDVISHVAHDWHMEAG